MIVTIDRRAEKAHDLIAHELVESAVVAKNRSRRQVVEAIEPDGYVRRLELLGERCKAADVDEENRDVKSLPARRSQLVSKRAEVRIFPRGANLQQTKRQRADPEKGNETFFTAFAGREKTIEAARHLRSTEPRAKRDKKFFHKVLKTHLTGTEKPG